MSTLGKAVIELSADTAKFGGDMASAEKLFDRSIAGIKSGLGALATLGSLAAGSMLFLTKSTIDSIAKLDDLSASTALSVETLSSLEQTARIGGHSFEMVTASATKFAKSVAEANGGNLELVNTFQRLGITQQQLRSQKFDELYVEFARKIATAENKTNAIAYATKLAGKSAADSIPFWEDLAETGLEQARVTTEQAAAAERIQKQLNRLQLQVSDVSHSFISDMLPALDRITKAMVDARKGGEGFFGTLTAGIRGFTGDDAHKWNVEFTKASDALLSAQQNLERVKANAAASGNSIFDPMTQSIGRFEAQVKKAQAEVDRLMAIKPLIAPDAAAPKAPVLGDLPPPPEDAAKLQREAEFRAEKAVELEAMAEEDRRGASIALANEAIKAEKFREEQLKQTIAAQVESAEISQQAAEELIYTYDRAGNAIQLTRESFEELERQQKTNAEIGRELGLTFTSAFEDAVVAGKKFRDILQGIAMDIARIIVRKSITEPVGAAISKEFGGIDWGSMFGIGGGGEAAALAAGVQPLAEGTDFVPRDGLAFLHKGEAVTPAGENRGGLMINFNVNSLDPGTAASVILQNRRLITGIIEQAHVKAGRRSGMATS